MLKRTCLTASFLIAAVSAAYAFAVYGAIGDKYAKLGGDRGALGPALSDEANAPYGGRFNAFKNGFIYWHPKVGAFAVWGAIAGKWDASGRVNYGYPTTDESTTPDGRGRYNHFRAMQLPGNPESSIYWTPQTNAHVIYGDIRKKWASIGWERSPLGYPTSDEMQDGAYRRSNFEHGYIRWSAAGGAEVFTTSNAPTPSANTFGTLLVNGIEVEADLPGRGRTSLFTNDHFLSANDMCGLLQNPPPPIPDVNQLLKSLASTANGTFLKSSPFKIRMDISGSISKNCRARADVSTVDDSGIGMSATLTGNRIAFHMTTPDAHVGPLSIGAPGSVDPGFSVTFDLTAHTRLIFPVKICDAVGVETTHVAAINTKLDSTNITGDIVLAAKRFAEWLGAPDVTKQLTDNHLMSFPAMTKTAQEISPKLCSGLPANARLEHDYKSNLFVLRATTAAPDKGPVVR